MVTVGSIPMLLELATSIFFPFFIIVYLRNARHACIKYRLPRRTAVPMVLLTFYSICTPVITVFGQSWPGIGSYFLHFILIPFALVLFLVTEAMIVVLFQITELLMLPQTSTPRKVRRLTFYRWMLHPPVQLVLSMIVIMVLISPFLSIDINSLMLPDATAINIPEFEHAVDVLSIEIALLLLIILWLSWYISHVVDNFGLRHSYQQSFRGLLLVLILVALMRLVALYTNSTIPEDLHLPRFFSTLGAQFLVYFHIYLPVRSMQTSGQLITRRPRSSSRVHPNNLEEQKAILEKFLSQDHFFKSFLTFARHEYSIEPLLAFKALLQYNAGDRTVDDAIQLTQLCMVPHCELESEVGKKLWPIYNDKLNASRNSKAYKAPINFFHTFQQALLTWIVKEMLSNYAQHPLGVEYAAFARKEKSMDRLDIVLACVEDVDDS
ncbi:hypothetical protein THRCLA_07518 [Thraustotheca clavata]|uniref:RGS domain-containing protein n=1 Tax=Thraustotheca clavata TaxID=74557 RepID=A0A1V9ZD63_9STRA|nr:hypothetical protein THRCLA_07518 [Thraustotheca clavata]